MTATTTVPLARIALSWCHRDKAWKDALLRELPLGSFSDLRIEWWEDSHLACGEDLTSTITDRLGEADYVLALLSNGFFTSTFIRDHELPRFAGPTADIGSLPVLLRTLPGFGPEWQRHGIEQQLVFTRGGRSFAAQRGDGRTIFANELAAAIRRRVLGLTGYRPR